MFSLIANLTKIATGQLSQLLPLAPIDHAKSKVPLTRTVTKTRDGKHWFIAGRTGMGKTFLMKQIVKRMTSLHSHLNVYYLDTKKIGDFSASDGTVIMSSVAPDIPDGFGHRLVWQVLDDDKDEYDKFFRRILNAGKPALVVIDECVNMKFGDAIPRELQILLLQGRAFGIHVLGGTQEVAKSPRQLLSQATYIVSFALKNKYDNDTMIYYLDLTDVKKLNLPQYQFFYHDTSKGGEAVKMDSYTELLPLIH